MSGSTSQLIAASQLLEKGFLKANKSSSPTMYEIHELTYPIKTEEHILSGKEKRRLRRKANK